MTLKIYEWEWKTYPSAWKRTCSEKDALKIVNKLRRHFKVRNYCYNSPTQFTSNSVGHAFPGSGKIILPKRTIYLGMIIHEVAHLVGCQRYEAKHHNKKFVRALKMVHAYAAKKLWFSDEIHYKIEKKTEWLPLNEFQSAFHFISFQDAFAELTK